MADIKVRDTGDTVWTVLTSFGFTEEDTFRGRDKYFILDKKEAAIVTGKTQKARAEAVAVCIETAFALGIDSFSAQLCDKSAFDLLVLFGFENILVQNGDIKSDFVLSSNGTSFAYGSFEEERTVARIDIEKLAKLSKGEEEESIGVSKSLAFAEKGAEGIAYDICYNLRINGCIVEMYCGEGDIKSALEYAGIEGHSAIIRCYSDGTVEINELEKKEIIKTTVTEFLGYYEDDGCDCDHHHDCDCGHHHG